MQRVGAIGIKDKDLLVLKSLLALVGKTIHVKCEFVEDPADARVVFIGKLPTPEVAALAARFAGKCLIHCQSGDETPPPGVRTLAHCPPRVNELAALLGEVLAAPAKQTAPPPASFDIDDCLAGAIQLRIPKLLMDQPLLVRSPKAPPLLVDAHSGLRTVHADPAWFQHREPWRASVAECHLEIAFDQSKIADFRRHAARPFLGMRFWGVMSASHGRLSSRLSADSLFGLRKPPDFRRWPHLPWQIPLADRMLEQPATLAKLSAIAGQAESEVIDFLNAASAVGLLLEKRGP